MNKLINALTILAIAIIPLGFLTWLFCVTVISTGYVGVQTLFGKVLEQELQPGIHFLNPMSSVTKFDIKTQKVDEVGVIPSKEMLNMTLKTSINYHVDAHKVSNLYSTIGVNYVETLLEPNLRSSIRQVTSDYKAEQLFSGERDEISHKIQAILERNLAPRGIVIESVMLKEIIPPVSLQQAIELKQAHQQEAEGMQFKLQREKLEAERKQIEATGIQQFQEIVKRGIDKNLLTWKGIEATEMLAKSPNAKIIIIGNKDTNGLPLVLSGK